MTEKEQVSIPGVLLGDNVLIKIEKDEEKKINGIIIPNATKGQAQKGIIVKIGTAVCNKSLKEGTKVIVEKYAAKKVKINTNTYYVVDVKEILFLYEANV